MCVTKSYLYVLVKHAWFSVISFISFCLFVLFIYLNFVILISWVILIFIIINRRDSFITHRAFCDALAEESARATIINTSNPLLITTNHINNQNQNPPLISTPISSTSISHLNFQTQSHFNPLDSNNYSSFSLKKEHQNHHQITHFINNNNNNPPPWLLLPSPSKSSSLDPNQDLNLILNPNHNHHFPSASPSPHMSATALLQKAAQMGATISGEGATQTIRTHDSSSATNNNNNNNSNCNFGLNLSSSRDNQNHQILMMGSSTEGAGLSHALPLYRNNNRSSTAFSPSAFEGGSFDQLESTFGGVLKTDEIFINKDHNAIVSRSSTTGDQGGLSTRDFLGLRAISHSEFLSNIAAAAGGYSNCMNNNNGAGQTPQTQIQNQPTWQG